MHRVARLKALPAFPWTAAHCGPVAASIWAATTPGGFSTAASPSASPSESTSHHSESSNVGGGSGLGGRWTGSESTSNRGSVDPEEAAKFGRLSAEWWDRGGAFGPLHSMNTVRCRFIRDGMVQHLVLDSKSIQPLKGLRILDVGCGGGILSEALARLGASVTGIDVAPENIRVASDHVQKDPWIRDRVAYRHISAEDLLEAGETFDAVVASEVVEHVRVPYFFCKTLAGLTGGKGPVFVSTLSRTPQSFLMAIVGAEYLTGLVPRGTHDWLKFIKPEELDQMMEEAGLRRQRADGLWMNPATWQWRYSDGLDVNYIAMYVGKGEGLVGNAKPEESEE